MNKVCITVNGFDNVGKSKIITNTKFKIGFTYNIHEQHFVKPKRNNIWKRFYDFIYFSQKDDSDLYLLDRSFLETYFFEYYREHNDVNFEEVITLMELFSNTFNNFHNYVIKRDWKFIEPYHLVDIENLKTEDNIHNEGNTLAERYTEYQAYYRYIDMLRYNFPDKISLVTNPPMWFSVF